MIFEHLTTKEGVQFVLEAGPNVAGTVTPQHLLVNRNAMLAGGIRPHFYCLPILKTEARAAGRNSGRLAPSCLHLPAARAGAAPTHAPSERHLSSLDACHRLR